MKRIFLDLVCCRTDIGFFRLELPSGMCGVAQATGVFYPRRG